jgi:hypothetical protein
MYLQCSLACSAYWNKHGYQDPQEDDCVSSSKKLENAKGRLHMVYSSIL